MFLSALLSFTTSIKENIKDIGFYGSLITILSYTYGLISTPLFWILIFFSAFDFLFGVTAAIIHKELDWDKSLEGLIKKLYIGIIVFISALVDFTLVYLGINSNGIFHNFIMAALIGREFGSVLTNADRCGLWVPRLLKEAADKIKKIGNRGFDDK
jgi:toxin secretion/phage lysis holin